MNPKVRISACSHPASRSGLGIAGLLILASTALAQNAQPEPPLPLQTNHDARAAAAAVQAPQNLRPPPPVPSPIPAPTGSEMQKPTAGSPIPPQPPDAAPPPVPRSTDTAPIAQQPALPTGFQSKVTSSTSASGQFKVYAKDLQIRSPFASRCDDVAAQLKRLLRDDESWVLPVVVSIRTGAEAKPSGPAVSTSISQISNGGFHLQVTINVRPDLRPADIDTELTRILVAERILRNKNEITTKRSMVLPEWLLTGVSQAMTFRERSRPSAVFTAIFRSGKIYGIEEILDAAPGQLDALSRTIYETSCCALVLALIDQPDGPLGMRKFLSLLAVDSRDDRALLNACFPRLALSASSLNKWWSLQMASLATPSIFETLGATQSKKALSEALVIHYETTSDAPPKRTTVIADSDADSPPEPAPEEEKKRGFISRILGGSSSSEKKADEKPASTKPAEETKAEEEATHEEKKRGFFGRMFGAPGTSEEPTEESTKEAKKNESETAKAEPKKTAKEGEKSKDDAKPADEEQEAKKPGFLGRMFGGGKASEEAPAESKDGKKTSEPKKTDKPKAEPKPVPKPEKKEESTEKPTKAKAKASTKPPADEDPSEPKKRGFLGRMFGGSSESKSSDEPEKKAEKKSGSKKSDEESQTGEKKKSASVEPADPSAEFAALFDLAREQLMAEAAALWPSFGGTSNGHEVKLRLPSTKKKEEDSGDGSTKEEKPKAKPAEEKPAAKKTESESAKKDEPVPAKKPAASTKPKAKAKAEAPRPRLVPVSIPLEDYANIMKRKDRSQILEGTANSLRSLQTRINVLFRPIIADYITLITELQNGKTKDVEKRLAALRARTAKAYDQAKAVESQLDVYEANETKNYSGAFEDYLRLPALIDKELPVRDDPLSKYLDALDEEFGN